MLTTFWHCWQDLLLESRDGGHIFCSCFCFNGPSGYIFDVEVCCDFVLRQNSGLAFCGLQNPGENPVCFSLTIHCLFHCPSLTVVFSYGQIVAGVEGFSAAVLSRPCLVLVPHPPLLLFHLQPLLLPVTP